MGNAGALLKNAIIRANSGFALTISFQLGGSVVRALKISAAVFASVLLAAPLIAQQNVPKLAFDSVADFPKLPDGMNFGEVPGVAVNSKGHVFVFTRSNSAGGPAYAPTAAQLLEFDQNGVFVREVGKGLYGWAFAHSVRIDKDDNIWAIDKGSDMVIKFNPAGRVIWVFGRRKESADEDTKPWEHAEPPLAAIDGLFRQPTDVAWIPKATSTSATATSIRASRNMIGMAIG